MPCRTRKCFQPPPYNNLIYVLCRLFFAFALLPLFTFKLSQYACEIIRKKYKAKVYNAIMQCERQDNA